MGNPAGTVITLPSHPTRSRSALGFAFTLAAAVAAWAAATHAPYVLNWPEPLLASLPAAGATVGSRHRVLLYVIDGLRADVARDLPFLRQLARVGSEAELWADPPTYSAAQYVSLMTGVTPTVSGIRTNLSVHRLPLDNLAEEVHRAGGIATWLSEDTPWWGVLFSGFARGELSGPRRLAAIAPQLFFEAQFAVVHHVSVDHAGHRQGGVSPQYFAEAEAADATLRELAAAWGWPQSAVVVVSDHGHTARGGHGGEEDIVRHTWLVASGEGVRVGGALPHARTVDVAPTVAALLGVAAPAQSQGRTLTSLLDLRPDQIARLATADGNRIAAVENAFERRRAELEPPDRGRRAFRAAAVVTTLVAAWAVGRGRGLLAGVLAGLLTLVATFAAGLALGRAVSLSADRTSGLLALETGTVALVEAALLAGLFLSLARRNRMGWQERSFGAGFGIGGSLPALLCFVVVGAFAPRLECRPGWVAALPLLSYAVASGTCTLASALTGFGLLRSRQAPRP